jgi:sporulation protein YlmC with PRC-barrel domain
VPARLRCKHQRFESVPVIKNFNVEQGARYTESMLQLSASLLNKSVLSLRTGSIIATVIGPIINPDNLKIEGFYCQDRFDKQQLVLLYQDIREVLPQGYVVNDHDVLSEPEELVRLKQVMELNFELLGKQVVTVDKQKVGKVSDYATETGTMYVQKIYVAQSILKNLTGGSLSIDRSQVQEITPRRIIISELIKNAPAAAVAAV